MKIILCSLGVMSCILLLGAYFINRRRAPRIFLEERMAMQLEEQLEEKEKSWIEKLQEDLEHSETGITLYIYFLILAVSMVVLYVVANYLTGAKVGSFALSLCAVYVPREIVRVLAEKKEEEFDAAFCKSLKRMSASLRTSSTLPQAVTEIANSPTIPANLRKEMAKVMVDYEYGMTMQDAFMKLYERKGVEDIRGVALAIDISEKKGTKLFETFDAYADAVLKRKESAAEAKAALAGTKVTINTLVVIPFAFMAFRKANDPSSFDMFYDMFNGMGRYLMLFIIVYVFIGYYYCQKKTRIKL